MARKKKNKIVKMLVPASGDVQQQQLHQGHQPHHRHRRVNSNALVPAGGHCWPRDLTKPDLELECLDSIDDGHYHLAHTFPLYLLSVYFQKAILFANRQARPFVDIKRLKLPFHCAVVQELVNFAYDGQLNLLNVDLNTYEALLSAADYTVSVRMTAYLEAIKKFLFPDSRALPLP